MKQRTNWVPRVHQPKLVRVFGKAFEGASPAHVKALIEGPLSDLELELTRKIGPTLPELIQSEGRNETCKIFLETANAGLVRRRGRPVSMPQASIGLGAFFRLEFQTPYHGMHVLALQHVNELWAPLPVSFDADGRIIHVPGWDDDGRPDFMTENTHPGRNRFAVLQTRIAPPHAISMGLSQQSVLDLRSLNDLAHFYADHRPTERRLFYADIDIE
jgi:hypothetical protein